MSDVDALLAEREGYVRRGLSNRVAQVDAALARFGVVVNDAGPVETADATPPVKSRNRRA
jgi:hypothetical protein